MSGNKRSRNVEKVGEVMEKEEAMKEAKKLVSKDKYELSVPSSASNEDGEDEQGLPSAWEDVGQDVDLFPVSHSERPDWAALAVPKNGCISLGNLPLDDLDNFTSVDLVAVIKLLERHKLIAQQGFAKRGFGYGVLQSQVPKVDAVALVRKEVPKFDTLLTAICNAFATRMNVDRKNVFVRFVKIDSSSNGTPSGAHSLHTDTKILYTCRGVCSIFATEEGTDEKGMVFLSGPTKKSCTGEELTQGAMSVQLGGVGVHGTKPIPDGVMGLAIIVDIITEENAIPKSVHFYVPRPTPFFAPSPFIIVSNGTIESTALLIKSSPESNIQAIMDWLRWVARQLWRYLLMVESLGTITGEEQTRLGHWRARLSAVGE